MSIFPFVNVIRQSQPVSEPVTLAQAKEQLRIEDSFTVDDDLLNQYITVARSRCEQYSNRFFVSSDFLVLFNDFGDTDRLKVPFPDSLVNSITYLDSSNVEQAFTDYVYDADFQQIIPNSTFPVGTNVKVNIASGASYQRANQAILLYVSDYYEVRTAEKSKRNLAAESLLYPLRVEIGV
tara:strand:- start:1961 stop:2500 length:540 start_codon:yes stop_codon:yes gene_type:complete